MCMWYRNPAFHHPDPEELLHQPQDIPIGQKVTNPTFFCPDWLTLRRSACYPIELALRRSACYPIGIPVVKLRMRPVRNRSQLQRIDVFLSQVAKGALTRR